MEKLAEDFLVEKGLSLIERNYHCRYGELDLIFKDRKTVVFIEVKYRKRNSKLSPLESVGRSKQSKIIKSAQSFLLEKPNLKSLPCRFDVIGIEAIDEADCAKRSSNKKLIQRKNKENLCIEWVHSAFDASQSSKQR